MCYYLAMQFIVGLGNPGKEYAHTRHNLGFQFLDQLAAKWQLSFSLQKKFQAEVAKKNELVLLKPQTFMNNSGVAVQSMLHFYGADQQQTATATTSPLWVVFDDLDLEVGTYKIQFGTGPKVHNGLNSLYQHLHTNQFWHVRIGADGRQGDRSIPASDYVLTNFSAAERDQLEAVHVELMTRLEKEVTYGGSQT